MRIRSYGVIVHVFLSTQFLKLLPEDIRQEMFTASVHFSMDCKGAVFAFQRAAWEAVKPLIRAAKAKQSAVASVS
jgi:hypothetical protein